MKMVHGFDNKYSFLSNFYACQVEYEGITYPTSEHAFQAAKTLDPEKRKWIAAAPTPGQAKRRGHAVELRPDWEEVKDNVMLDIVREKFKNEDMRSRLITAICEGYDGFCEDNYWHDNYWGNCTCPKCCNIEGQNQLGKIIMQVANEIIKERILTLSQNHDIIYT